MKLSLAVGMELLSEIWNNGFVKDKRVILRAAIKRGRVEARQNIDLLLESAGWTIQDYSAIFNT